MKETLDLETVKNYRNFLRDFIDALEICIGNIEKIKIAQIEKVNLRPINQFLRHYVNLCYSNCSINIYKIYKSHEKRSFNKLFNKFKEFNFAPDLSRVFVTNKQQAEIPNLYKSKTELLKSISEFEKEITLHHKLLDKIKTRREKYYAHSDPDKQIEPETLAELTEIKELSKKIYNNLFGNLFYEYYVFSGNIESIQPVIEDRKTVDKQLKDSEKNLNR